MLGMLVAGVLLVSAEPWQPDASPTTNGMLLVFAAAVMAVGLVPLLPGPWRTKFVRRRGPAAESTQRVTVDPTYFAVERDGVERRVAWSKVGLRFLPSLVIVDLPDRRVALPHRVFAGSAQRDAVLTALRAYRREGAQAVVTRRKRQRSDPFAPPRNTEP